MSSGRMARAADAVSLRFDAIQGATHEARRSDDVLVVDLDSVPQSQSPAVQTSFDAVEVEPKT